MREPKNFGHIDKHLHLSTCLLVLAVAAGDFSSAANSRISPPVNTSNTTFCQHPTERLNNALETACTMSSYLPHLHPACLLACLLGVPCPLPK